MLYAHPVTLLDSATPLLERALACLRAGARVVLLKKQLRGCTTLGCLSIVRSDLRSRSLERTNVMVDAKNEFFLMLGIRIATKRLSELTIYTANARGADPRNILQDVAQQIQGISKGGTSVLCIANFLACEKWEDILCFRDVAAHVKQRIELTISRNNPRGADPWNILEDVAQQIQRIYDGGPSVLCYRWACKRSATHGGPRR